MNVDMPELVQRNIQITSYTYTTHIQYCKRKSLYLPDRASQALCCNQAAQQIL